MTASSENLPIVALIRRLSEPRLATAELIRAELDGLGFEQLPIKVPARPGVVKFKENFAYKKDTAVVQVSAGTGREGGRHLSHLSISALDKAAQLSGAVSGVSAWLGADPEYPARAAQFTVVENGGSWVPISQNETQSWNQDPVGRLAHISVDDTGFGILITRIVTQAV
jgi:hypothetical protein